MRAQPVGLGFFLKTEGKKLYRRVAWSVGLDEIPQLVNILKGEMSIVGPRPALPRVVAQYGSTSGSGCS